jgi:hypothetical protein
MIALLTPLVMIGFGADRLAPSPDSEALSAAITHARTVVTEGDILVSPGPIVGHELPSLIPGGQPPEPALLEQAARAAGFSFGPDNEALRCEEPGACRAVGSFRGLVHVAEYRQSAPDSVAVMLRVFQFTPVRRVGQVYAHLYEQVDEVHVSRSGPTSEWRIENVVRISET